MSALPKRFFTPAEYLELEAVAEYKSQYFAGEIFAMAGVQPEHDRITTNLIVALGVRFKGRPCTVFSSDMRVHVADDLYTYPDVTALCGEAKFSTAGRQPPSLLNPRAVVEVLSRSTEVFDRGIKSDRYHRLESLSDYVMVSTDSICVEHHRLRDDGKWEFVFLTEPDHTLDLLGLDCRVPLAEIYEGLSFPLAGGR